MAPSARRGKPTRSINITGRANGGAHGDGDARMADAGGSSGAGRPERRIRSGTRPGGAGSSSAASSLLARTNVTPYGTGRRGAGLSPAAAERIRNANNKPALLRDKDAKGAVESLRLLIQNRWNPQAGLLNLENMASDPAFVNSKLKAPGQKGAAKNTAPALWKLASEMCPNLLSLSLAANNLSGLTDLYPGALIRFLPGLQNLSLQNNQLSQFADLNPLSTVVGAMMGSKPGLGELKELMLTGNPLQVRESQRNMADYQGEVRRRFPALTMLDQTPIDQTIAVPKGPPPANGLVIAGRSKREREVQSTSNLRSKVHLPLTMQPGFVDTETSQNAMGQFLVKFFTTFDGDRSQLIFAYAPQATFSLSVNTTVSERARRTQKMTPEEIAKQKELSWGTYLGSAYNDAGAPGKNQENLSRNFIRTKSTQRREETLHTGPEAIAAFSTRLPKTAHPLTDADKFVVDTWQQSGTSDTYPELLVIAVHGEYVELPSNGRRSFDRTFIIAPTLPGSAAATAGWPCVIVSDLLVLRNWTNPSLWKVIDPPSQAVPDKASMVNLPEDKQSLMAALHKQTRLNADFCFQCLEETGWSLQAAMQAFEAAKASIPQAAYVL